MRAIHVALYLPRLGIYKQVKMTLWLGCRFKKTQSRILPHQRRDAFQEGFFLVFQSGWRLIFLMMKLRVKLNCVPIKHAWIPWTGRIRERNWWIKWSLSSWNIFSTYSQMHRWITKPAVEFKSFPTEQSKGNFVGAKILRPCSPHLIGIIHSQGAAMS